MADTSANSSSLFLYQTEDGRTRVQCRFENEPIWPKQAIIAELFEARGNISKLIIQFCGRK